MKLGKNPEKNIVLLHGWGANTGKLQPLAKALKKLGWSTLNLKLPGFDLSPPPEPWDLAHYATFVSSQVDKKWKGRSCFVFGHSFGGRITIFLAASKLTNLQGLVLCAPGGLSRATLVKRAFFWSLAKAGKVLLAFTPGSLVYKKILYRAAREYDYEKAKGVMRETLQKIVAEDLRPKLADIHLPSLILWGTADKTTPFRDGQLAQRKIKQAKLVTFENETHRLPYNQPQKIAKEVDSWFGSLS